MGTCCSKRNRCRAANAVDQGVALHPSLENWKIRNQPSLLELDHDAGAMAAAAASRIPAMWAKPAIKPSLGFSSMHCSINSNALSVCQSIHSSSRSRGVIAPKPATAPPQLASISNGGGRCLKGPANHQSVSTITASPHADISEPSPEPENEVLPPFSFATQPYIEPDLCANTAFAFHPATQSPRRSMDGIKFQVRHKHMFPEEFQAMKASLISPMKRSWSEGRLPKSNQHDDQHMGRHRSSFHKSTTVYEAGDAINGCVSELSRASISREGGSSCDYAARAVLSMTDTGADYPDDEDDANFHDIDVGARIDEDFSRSRSTYEFKLTRSDEAEHGKLQKAMHEAIHGESGFMEEKAQMKQKQKQELLSIVSTGDAILFSGSNPDELHLIPSKHVTHPCSPPPISPLHPVKLGGHNMHPRRVDGTCLSVEDIMLLLERDDTNEDDLLSLLIDTKSSSPRQLPSTASPSTSLSSSSTPSVTTSSSTSSLSSSLSSSSTSSSSSPPRPWFPHPPSASPGSPSQPLLSSMMPLLSPFSIRSPSSSAYSLSQCPSSRRMSPPSSFEFKVKSCNSAVSTPMFSPLRSTAKRNIAHLKPTALTTEEIAEIWGVFEQRQTLLNQL